MSAFENAKNFFEACEAPKGWESCKDFVASGASFSCQSGALADVKTVQGYCDWLKGLADGPLPGNSYTVHAKSWDADTNTAIFVSTFHATHKGDGGPVTPTNKSTNTDYVYAIKMDSNGKVAAMTKIWNDGFALAELGWA